MRRAAGSAKSMRFRDLRCAGLRPARRGSFSAATPRSRSTGRRARPTRSAPGSALDVGVAGLAPGQHGVALVVEDEVAPVGADHQHGVAGILLVDHHGDAQGAARYAGRGEALALQQHEVLAVALAVRRDVPAVDHAPMVLVGDRDDVTVDPLIGPDQQAPQPRRQFDGLRLACVDSALPRHALAEIGPGVRSAGLAAGGDRGAGDRQIGALLRLGTSHAGDGDDGGGDDVAVTPETRKHDVPLSCPGNDHALRGVEVA